MKSNEHLHLGTTIKPVTFSSSSFHNAVSNRLKGGNKHTKLYSFPITVNQHHIHVDLFANVHSCWPYDEAWRQKDPCLGNKISERDIQWCLNVMTIQVYLKALWSKASLDILLPGMTIMDDQMLQLIADCQSFASSFI